MTRWLVLGLLALGCGGKAVDLGHAGWSDASESEVDATAPQTLYQSNEMVLGLTIDDSTLYALIVEGSSLELVSCPIDECRSRRETLFRGPKPVYDGNQQMLVSLVSAGDRLFWPIHDEMFFGFASCAKTGCEQPDRIAANNDLLSDGQQLYWFETEAASSETSLMTIEPGSLQPQLVRADITLASKATEPRAARPSAPSDYLYFGGPDLAYRIIKDGSADPELVAEDEDLTDLAVDGEHLFYATEILAGRIAICPASGCIDGAATLVADQWYPGGLQVAGDELFWLNGSPRGQAHGSEALMSCRLPDCQSVKDWGIDFARHDEYGGSRVQKLFITPHSIIWLEKPADFASAIRQVAR